MLNHDVLNMLDLLVKAQAGEESGEFRGGDPEDLQQKREEKREEQENSGELEDDPEEEGDMDQSEIDDLIEEENEKMAEKSYHSSINSGASEVSPVDTLEDYRPRNINGDPLDQGAKVDPVPLTSEARPGANQSKPWSEVLDPQKPTKGESWSRMKHFVARGEHASAAIERAKLFKALNHGITFEPGFYIAKAKKGEVVPGHKYIYRWMDEGGVWQYEYSGGTHTNHGPAEIGNMQGHTLEVPEGWVDSNDPNAKLGAGEKPQEAYEAAKEHLMTHGGIFPTNYNGEKMLMKVKGHKGGKRILKPIEFVREAAVREHHKVPEGTPLDLDKHKIKFRMSTQDKGGFKFRSLENMESSIRRQQTHTEVDAEGKPFMEWRFAGEAGEKGKGRKKDAGKGRNISYRFLDSDHPTWEAPASGGSKDGWDHSSHKDIGSFREFVSRKKREHAQLLGHVNLSEPLPDIEGKPTLNHIQSGGIKKKTGKVTYQMAGKFDPDYYEEGFGKWIEPGSETVIDPDTGKEVVSTASKRYKKERTVIQADISEDSRADILNKLCAIPGDEPGKEAGEMFYLLAYAANRELKMASEKKDKRGSSLVDNADEWRNLRFNLLIAGTAGVSRALDTFDPSRGVRFSTFAFSHMVAEQKKYLRATMSEEGERRFLSAGKTVGRVADRVDEARGRKYVENRLDKLETVFSETDTADHFEDGLEWADRAEDHLNDSLFSSKMDSMTPEEIKDHYDSVQQSLEELNDIRRKYEVTNDPTVILEYINHKNDPTRGGDGFLPPLRASGEEDLLDKMDKFGRGGEENPEEILKQQFGENRWNAPLDELHDLMLGSEHAPEDHVEIDSKGMPKDPKHPYWDTEHSKVGLVHPDVRAYLKQHSLGTVGNLLSKLRHDHPKDKDGNISNDAINNIGRFTSWLRDDKALDADYGPTPAREGYEKSLPGELEVLRAVSILRKAETPQMEDSKGQKLFQPIPNGVELEENPDYDPDPSSGKNWHGKYQDPNTGSTRYSYLHQDRVGNPKMHHNNLMRYLDAQLPKIRAWYKERINSEDPMDRAVGLYMMLLDQAKIDHEDEVEGSLSSLKVGQVEHGDGDVITFNLGDTYKVNFTLDDRGKAALDELLQGKNPEDPVFSVGDQVIDAETIESFLQDTFGVGAQNFKKLHTTHQYSKEFQKVADGGIADMEEAKEQALGNTAESLGYENDPNHVRDHVDPVAQEALHMMVKKSVMTDPLTGETLPTTTWVHRYKEAVKKAAQTFDNSLDYDEFVDIYLGDPVVFKSHVRHVSSDPYDKDTEEGMFSQWLHDYPMHEHEYRWDKQQKKDEEDKDRPKVDRTHTGAGVEVKTHDRPDDEDDGEFPS